MKKISIIGSTGYIGRKTLEVIKTSPDHFQVVALAGGHNTPLLIQQAREFKPSLVSVSTQEGAESLRREVGEKCQVTCGQEGLIDVAIHPESNFLVAAAVGSLGLISTLKAIESGKDIAIANKEALVMGGALIMKAMEEKGTEILPIDSEHSALHQCLRGERVDNVKKLILTASGGPFRNFDKKNLKSVSPKQALKHPTWSMGKKITIDSATLMNKGLEIIEAHWLFGIDGDHIEVLLHPQSIIHSMVEFLDGSIKSQMGVTDMKVPIQYALTYPERVQTDLVSLDLTSVGPLEFFAPDFEKFPCLRLAYQALRKQGTMPAILNASNEVAVQSFLDEKITFDRIPQTIESVMDKLENKPIAGLETLLEADAMARRSAEDYIRRLH